MKRWFKMNWGLVCLLAAVLLLCISGTLMAYTNFNSVRRLVSVNSDSNVLFYSNLLYAEPKSTDESDYRTKKLTLTENQFTLNIYNHFPGDTATVNDQDITYTLKCTLLSASDNGAGFSVDGTKFSPLADGSFGTVLSGQTLTGNTASMKSYSIVIPDSETDIVRIRIEAIPNDASYAATKQHKLAAVILHGELVAEDQWTGRIIDQQKGRKPADYDGFNYEISGTGAGKVTLTWDASALQLDPWFQSAVTNPPSEVIENPFTFEVGGENQPTAYQLQFYWVSRPDDEMSWEELSSKITVSFQKNENASAGS